MGLINKHIFLDRTITKKLIDDIYGDVFGLVSAWEDKAATQQNFPRAKQRSTILRWLSDGVPVIHSQGTSDFNLFALCSLIDVDPLAIFDYERNGFFSKFAQIRQFIYLGMESLGGLSPILEMLKPSDYWPSDYISNICYGHPWFRDEFTNQEDWEDSSDYILVKANFISKSSDSPRALHIAYRRIATPDTMWRYYGTVIMLNGELHLYNEAGIYLSMKQLFESEIRFRTYYGGRPVIWRVASLHEMKVDFECPFNDMSIIGFDW